MGDKKQVLALMDEMGEEINKKRGYDTGNVMAVNVGGPVFDEIIRRDDTHIFVAEDGGKIIGCVTFYVLPNIRHGWHRGHIEDMIVSSTHRGKGVGSALFSAVRLFAKDHNIKVIKLDSGVELTDAHRFYEKQGGKFTEKMFRFDL